MAKNKKIRKYYGEDHLPEAEDVLVKSIAAWEQIETLSFDEKMRAVDDAFTKYDMAQIENFSRDSQDKIWMAIWALWRFADPHDPAIRAEIGKQVEVRPVATWEQVQNLTFDEKMKAINDGFKSREAAEMKKLSEAVQDEIWDAIWTLWRQARRYDPDMDAELKRQLRSTPFEILRLPCENPPAPDRLRLLPLQAPIVAAVPGESEHYLTYAEMQDWPFGPQMDALVHALKLTEAPSTKAKSSQEWFNDSNIRSADSLVSSASWQDESLKVAMRWRK